MTLINVAIDNLGQLTAQQVLDMAIDHINTTRRRSVRESVKDARLVCEYGGIGCAAAPFIKPEYREKLRGGWEGIYFEGPRRGQPQACTPSSHVELIVGLQMAHDGSKGPNFMAEWKAKVDQLAADLGLDSSRIQLEEPANG